ncbi:MAG: YdcF family protein [Labilibaculum sp.]|nr:YdcF family protein [Labilibaculum sp.]
MKAINYFLIFITVFVMTCCGSSIADPVETETENKNQIVEFNANHELIWSSSKVQDRNFYLLTLFEEVNKMSQVLETDPVFTQFLATSKARLSAISKASNPSAQNYADALKFNTDEIEFLSDRFKYLLDNSAEMQDLVSKHMRPSGTFQQFSEVTDDYRLVQLAFIEAVEGINNILDVYIAGADPLYEDIDKVSFDVNSSTYLNLLNTEIDKLNNSEFTLFFQPFLKAALKALELNSRDEAGRYFPMEENINKATCEYIKTIDFDAFNYSVILVLGDSPNSDGDLENISIGGMQRADHGVDLYKQGKAPLLAFTGGHLCPIHTIYSEAIEMKKYVMKKYNIPENRILVDPHSRHTTTNLRNIGRQIFRYGIPTDKKAIVSTSESHSEYVASDRFQTRSIREMKHIPLELYERLSKFDLEFTSKIEVLHLDASDPLDP